MIIRYLVQIKGRMAKILKEEYLELCLGMLEKILKRVKEAKEPEEINKIIPSWSVLNRLHAYVSSLLVYHH